MNYTRDQAAELGLLALLIWREARDQIYEAMLGVGWSVRNRVTRPRYWGTDWVSCIGHKWAYSSMTAPGDPNLIVYPDTGLKAWETVSQAAEMAYSGTAQDPANGATHYFSHMASPPAWAIAPDTEFVTQIGAFRFYKAA